MYAFWKIVASISITFTHSSVYIILEIHQRNIDFEVGAR